MGLGERYDVSEMVCSSHCVHSCVFHAVWCVKYRHPILSGNVGEVCRETLREACVERGWGVLALEVMPDHVHVLLRLPPSIAVSSVVGALKSISCNSVFRAFPRLKQSRFWGSGLWSRGYFVSTVGSNLEVVQHYIETQFDRPYEPSHC